MSRNGNKIEYQVCSNRVHCASGRVRRQMRAMWRPAMPQEFPSAPLEPFNRICRDQSATGLGAKWVCGTGGGCPDLLNAGVCRALKWCCGGCCQLSAQKMFPFQQSRLSSILCLGSEWTAWCLLTFFNHRSHKNHTFNYFKQPFLLLDAAFHVIRTQTYNLYVSCISVLQINNIHLDVYRSWVTSFVELHTNRFWFLSSSQPHSFPIFTTTFHLFFSFSLPPLRPGLWLCLWHCCCCLLWQLRFRWITVRQ